MQIEIWTKTDVDKNCTQFQLKDVSSDTIEDKKK